jgi:hypothetical protein
VLRSYGSMLTIRPEQFEAYSRAQVERFEDWVLEHRRKFFPKQCGAWGETKARELIKHGIRRAAGYGITAERDV